MRITGKNILQAAINKSPQSIMARDLKAWLAIATQSNWVGPADVQSAFSQARSLGGGKMREFPMSASVVTITAIIGFKGNGSIVVKKVQ